eukprot:tig00021098_g18202.t1
MSDDEARQQPQSSAGTQQLSQQQSAELAEYASLKSDLLADFGDLFERCCVRGDSASCPVPPDVVIICRTELEDPHAYAPAHKESQSSARGAGSSSAGGAGGHEPPAKRTRASEPLSRIPAHSFILEI